MRATKANVIKLLALIGYVIVVVLFLIAWKINDFVEILVQDEDL